MPVIAITNGLLVLSNVFMTFAAYAHLKNLSDRSVKLDYLRAALCIMGAVYFIFRSPAT